MKTQLALRNLAMWGLCLALPAGVVAQEYSNVGHGRGRRYQNYCPPNYYPSHPSVVPDMAPDADGMAPDADTAPDTDTSPDTTPDTADTAPQLPTASALSSGPSLGGGAPSPMLGRVDQQNRLNLFDTQSAQPVTRAWYTFQYAQDYSTGVVDSVGGVGSFTNELPNQFHHRFGLELAASRNFSVAVQFEYVVTTDQETFVDFWNNPQLQLKQVVYRDCGTVVSGILGFQFQDDIEDAELKEDTTKIYPGMLVYTTLSNDSYMQGGFQFGLPLEGVQVYHFDWALAYGRYLYRHRCHGRYNSCGCGDACGCESDCGGYGDCGAGCGGYGDCGGCGGCYGGGGLMNWMHCRAGIPVTAVIAQLEIFGKHVIDDATYELTTFTSSPGSFTRATFSERRDVVDLTAGGSMLIGDGYGVSAGIGIPLTGGEVRNIEVIASAWKTF